MFLKFTNLSKFQEIEHLITTKDSSKDANFSLALHTGENTEVILKNRAEISKQFQPESTFISLLQTHSSRVFKVESRESIGWEEKSQIEADALITDLRGVVLTILTADCVPILLFEPEKRTVGAIHSGWRGTEKNIVKETIKKMQNEYQISTDKLIVGVAPSIRSCCYEVGVEVARVFESYQDAVVKRDGSYYLDVATVVIAQLRELGVLQENIELSPSCTSCCNKTLFSYRKDKTAGRFMSMLMLK